MATGFLKVFVYANDESTPIEGAIVKIKNIDKVNITNNLGTTGNIVLDTYPKSNSVVPNINNVSYKYDILVECSGFTSIEINSIEVFDGVVSIQDVFMKSGNNDIDVINMEPILLESDYVVYNKEEFDSPSSYVLKDVIIPEYIIVHDGYPSDNANNYNVTFSDYIKNVASSEVYPTWEVEALKANVLAIISFTLNRVYTEWYPSKGYSFTITSVISYDQKYTHNRTIYDSIIAVVDEVLPMYIKRVSKEEPMFAQYCDGVTTKNEGALYQWGSQELAINGYSYYKILNYYYGSSIEFKDATYSSGLPTSFPGYVLSLGSCGEEVKVIQEQMNIIRGNYPGLIKIDNPNGEFDSNTVESVKFFQKTFSITQSGNVDYATWYKLSYLYIAVQRMIFGIYDR